MTGDFQVSFFVPITTVSGLNVREHHMVRARRVKRERNALLLRWPRRPVPVPCEVSLVRVSPRMDALDDDAVPGAVKAVRDEIARLIGVDDKDKRVSWRCHQGVGEWGVQVLICAASGGAILPERPRRAQQRRPRKPASPRLLQRAQEQAGFRATPNFIPARKP